MGDGSINVETSGLTGFAEDVRSETDLTLEPTAGRVRGTLASGVRFGASSASGYVYAAKHRYQESLRAATANLAAYIEAAQILAAAAEKVAANYDASDARARGRSDQVDRALAEAVAEAQARQPRPRGGKALPL